MPSWVGEHRMGRHKKRKVQACTDCYPVVATVAGTGKPHVVKVTAVDPANGKDKSIRTRIKAAPVIAPVKVKRLPQPKYETREAWMIAAIEKWRPMFKALGHDIPAVRVSVGWPHGRGNRKDILGQCFAPASVADGQPAIFVSPIQHNPTAILETIGHELIHAVNHAWAHRAPFQKVALALGYENGAKVQTNANESPVLFKRLTAWAKALGTFPHSQVNPGGSAGKGPGVQSTRMLKVVCPEDGYTVRTTRKWLDVGNPSCPKGHEMAEVVGK